MNSGSASLLGFTLFAVPVALLAFGLVQARLAARSGGIAAGLARILANPSQARRWITYLSATFGAFLFVAACNAAELVQPAWAGQLMILESVGFITGAVTITLMLTVEMGVRDLSLAEEMRLQEDHPDVLGAVERNTSRRMSSVRGTMYVVPTLPADESPKD